MRYSVQENADNRGRESWSVPWINPCCTHTHTHTHTHTVTSYPMDLEQLCLDRLSRWLKSNDEVDSLPLPTRLKDHIKELMTDSIVTGF